ncbi:MAG: PASTA domain-containing protein [Candidatus Cloacimonetes bacterium]|nr:PASTA domain-containing protein [Candidatus Cloacimonadota bacterium]MBT6994286.1 PASTA domain-containing protein [Candidatus Cloacimonadota bacterium]MBT7469990.1 PASTA domain-containing protein [Candidatus Cloacimonadota bacterium]
MKKYRRIKLGKFQPLLPIIISLVAMLIIFIVAFFATNLVMKIVVGHKNVVEVPNLENVQFDVARKQCRKMKLFVRLEQKVYSDSIPRGYIVSQKPKSGLKTKKNRTIEVAASLGPEMVRIPFLENLTVLQAKLKLQNAGLRLGKETYRYSEDVKKDRIIYSKPMADKLISKKGRVEIIVSMGNFSQEKSNENWIDLLND